MNLKGTLPLLILRTLSGGPNHGYRIAQQIKRTSRGVLDFKEGTLYPALHALEAKGYLESYEEVRNGRRLRFYRLTESGRKALNEELAQWRRVSKAVTLVLEGAG